MTEEQQSDPNRSVLSCDLVYAEMKKTKQNLPSIHHGKRLVMASLADKKQRCVKKEKKRKKKKRRVRLRLCRLCRQLTVSQPSHGECAERELRFDHLSGLTDSVHQCVHCVCGVFVFVGLEAQKSVCI